jgi:putative membrane-bound dehydrogenase-like protein
VWKKGAPRQAVTAGRINWEKRDVDWADRINFRGKDDADSPVGEWNRLEVIAKGDTLQYFVNGAMVNEAFEAKPSAGKIALQTEGAEMIVRRYELWPLGAFTEKWNPIQASGGSDITVRDGQDQPVPPEESQKLIELDGPYEVQLVASEPLILDPVECAWDADGRMYVADMRDYPLGPPNPGDPWLSRIQLLTDEDGDGRMDKAITFADHMDHVQGLLPYNGGLIATTRSQILFLKDTDGDGKADEIKPLIRGFNPRHSQLQVSAPRWGLDNCVHFNNGLDAKEIYPADHPNAVVNVPRSNFRWNPRTGAIEPTGGAGQYGGAFDDFGRHFSCSNRNPVMFVVMPHDAVNRNPRAGIEKGSADIAPAGAETRVFPKKITHTTADAHAGTNTACSGLGTYRGQLMPELRNNVFVPDPTGQLVTRYRVEPDGASLRAVRVGERTEFFRSSDEWCRPVNFTTGPDEAIYICDIYRRWIDHARFFPEEFVKTHDMRQGEKQGRIWRVVPKSSRELQLATASPEASRPGLKPKATFAAPRDTAGLRAWAQSDNGWQRDTARRLLAERGAAIEGEPEVVPHTHPARKTFFEIVRAPDDGKTREAKRVESRAAAIGDAPEDEWMAKAVLSSSAQTAGAVLQRVIADGKLTTTFSPRRVETLRTLASAAAAAGVAEDFADALKGAQAQAQLAWWQPPVLQGFAEGLPKSGGKLGLKTLAEFVTKSPAPFANAAAEIGKLMKQMDATVGDANAPEALRLACLPLLPQRKWDDAQPVLRQLLAPGQPAALQTAALALLKRFGTDKTSPMIYELLPNAGPAVRRELVAQLAVSAKSALDLFKRMERGELSPALVEIETRWRWQRGKGELRDLAVKLFGQPSEDRAGVITSYMDATKLHGDAQRGQAVFSTLCITCHKHGALGVEVGPPLSDVRAKPPEALLSDILDPNRMFEARWSAYQIDAKDGRTFVGLITAENSDSVTITMMGGVKESVQRSAIKEMKSLDRSLMPPGLEGAITKEQMADLLAFLRGV